MTLSDIAQDSLKAALIGRTVYYDRTVEQNHMPKGRGEVIDLIVDENGKIHIQANLTTGLGREAAYWAPLAEWTIVGGIILS